MPRVLAEAPAQGTVSTHATSTAPTDPATYARRTSLRERLRPDRPLLVSDIRDSSWFVASSAAPQRPPEAGQDCGCRPVRAVVHRLWLPASKKPREEICTGDGVGHRLPPWVQAQRGARVDLQLS